MDTESDSDTDWEANSFANRVLHSPVLRAKNRENESDMNLNVVKSVSDKPSSNLHRDLPESLMSAHNTGNRLLDSNTGQKEEFCSESFAETHHPIVMERNYRNSTQQDLVTSTTRTEMDKSRIECLILHRLPGEKLGMILGVIGDKGNREKVKVVRVRSVTIGGAAERASGGSRGVGVGDEILEINGLDLQTLTYDECVSVFREMPLQVFMLVKRGKSVPQNFPEREVGITDIDGFLSAPPKGFTLHTVHIQKKLKEPLGLSIVPSYGTTKHFYQIKRLLGSGPCAKNCQLCVGDRLLSYNNTPLQNLVQSECMSILKQPNENVTFTILRPANSGQRLRISVNTHRKKDVAWYSSGLDSTSDTTDSDTEGSLTNSEEDRSEESPGFSLDNLETFYQPEVNEVFSNKQFKIAYAEPTLGSQVTAVSNRSVGCDRLTSSREIHHFYPHGLPESVKMEDSSGEKNDRHDAAMILQPADMDWLDSLNNVKSNEQTTDQSSVSITTQKANSSNDNGPLLDFSDDLVNLESQGMKQSVNMSNAQLPPPAEFADLSSHATGEISNQNGYRDVWQSGFCETEFITEADNDVPVTNIDDLLEKSQGVNHQRSPSEGDSGLYSESSASENLLDFEKIQTPVVSSERLFYQPPQEIASGDKQDSDLGDLLGGNSESEVEQIFSGRMVSARERDEDENLSTFSSHSGSTVIHRCGSPHEEVDNSSKDATKDECNLQEHKSGSNLSDSQDIELSSVDHAPRNDETVGMSVTKTVSASPELGVQEDIDGEVVSLYISESENHGKSPLLCEPCIVEEHTVAAQQGQQTEAIPQDVVDPGNSLEAELTPVHAPRDIVINLEGATDVQVPPQSLPDRTVLPELVDSLVEVCNADDRKASLKREDDSMSVTVHEDLILPSEKTKELNAEMSPTVQQTEGNESMTAKQTVSVDESLDSAKFTLPSKQENGTEGNTEMIVPVKAPRRSPPTSSQVGDLESGQLDRDAMPNLVDSLVQNLEKEKKDELQKSGQMQTGPVVQEENIIPSKALRESASVVTDEKEQKDNQSSTNLTLSINEELIMPIQEAQISTSYENGHVSEQPNKTETILDTAVDKAQLGSSNLMFTDSEPTLSKHTNNNVCSTELPSKSRKSKLDDSDVIVPVKVPRRSAATDSLNADATSTDKSREEALPKLVDSLVQYLEGNGQSCVINSAEETSALVHEDIVCSVVSRESASPPVEEIFHNEEENDVPIGEVCEVILDVSTSNEVVKSGDSSLALNGHPGSANSFMSLESFSPSYVSSQKGTVENMVGTQKESTDTPVPVNSQSNGTTDYQHEPIEPVKAPRRFPEVESTESEKMEEFNSQPFVDHLVTHLDSENAFSTKLEITEPGDVIKEDNIVPVAKPVERSSLNDKNTQGHGISSEVKLTPAQVKSVDAKIEKSPPQNMSSEVRPEPLKPESVGESLSQAAKEETLPVRNNTALSNNSSTQPLAFPPVTLSDQPVSRRLPSIKAFTARGFTPVKLNSLGSSSVIKTVSLDRSKINRLSGANIQPAPIPSFKLAEVNKRSETGPFQIDLLSGILGLGIKVTRQSDGFYRISDIQKNSPVEKNGHIRVGDYLLSVNGTEITGLPDTKVQQILRLLPRGIIKLVMSTKPLEKDNTRQGSSSNDNVKHQEGHGEVKKQMEVQPDTSWSFRNKAYSFTSLSASTGTSDPADSSISTAHQRAVEKGASAGTHNQVPKISVPREESDSLKATKLEGTFSVRKVEIVDIEHDAVSPKKVAPPPVMPRQRGRSSEDLSLNVDVARKEAAEQQSEEQNSEGSVDVRAYPIMVRPSASPRTSISIPKGPPPPVMPRTRPRSQTSESDSPRNLSFESISPQLSPRTPDTKDVLESNRKPSSVAKQFGTVKSPMSRKMSGLIDKFQHEEVSPVSPESDKVFSPRMSFENSDSGQDLRKHFSFSVSEEPKPETKTQASPKSPPKVAPKPKRRSGEIKYSQGEVQSSTLTETGSKEPHSREKDNKMEKKSASSTSVEDKHDKNKYSGVKLTARPHSVETVFNTRSLVSTSSVTRLKGLQIPSKSIEPADVSEPSSTLQVNPSKLAPALRPRSGPAAFTRIQPKIQQVTPKLNLMPIKLQTNTFDNDVNKAIEKAETSNPPHSAGLQDKPLHSQEVSSGTEIQVLNTFSGKADDVTSHMVMRSDINKVDKHLADVEDSSLGMNVKAVDECQRRLEAEEKDPKRILAAGVSTEAKNIDDNKALKGSLQGSAEMNIPVKDSSERGGADRVGHSDSSIASERDESEHSSLEIKGQAVSSTVNPEIPLFEKFAETVSSDVIDSSLLTASSLISTNGQAGDPNETDEVSLDSAHTEDKPNGEAIEARSLGGEELLPDSQNSSAAISVEIDSSHTEKTLLQKRDRLPETIPTHVLSDSIGPSSEQEPNIPLKQTEGNTATSPAMVLPSGNNEVVIEAGNLVLNGKQEKAMNDAVSQARQQVSSSKSTQNKENFGKPLELMVDGSGMVPSAAEPPPSDTNVEDSDVPPSLPSSAPPPLPSSPPPDLITGLRSPPLRAEQSVMNSMEPRPPLALRRHQDAVHNTSSQVVDSSSNRKTPTSPSTISLLTDTVSNDEPLTTDSSMEFQDAELVASTPCEDNKSLMNTIEPSSPEEDLNTIQSTETAIPDVGSSSHAPNTPVCVPSNVSANPLPAKDGGSCANTDKAVAHDATVSSDVSPGPQTNQSNGHVKVTSEIAPADISRSSEISSAHPIEQNNDGISQTSQTTDPVTITSTNTLLKPQTDQKNGHSDQTGQTVSTDTSVSPDTSLISQTDQSNGYVAQTSQSPVKTVVTSNRRKVTLISKKPEGPGASSSSDTTFLPPDELTSLLNKANEALEKTGSNDDEIIIVVLHKDIGEKVGLSFKSGSKNEILISDIEKNSTAGKDGHLKVQDRLLMVNGKTVVDRTPQDARIMLRTSREKLVLVLGRQSGETQPRTEETVEIQPRTQEMARPRRKPVNAEGNDLVSTEVSRRTSQEKAVSPSPERITERSRAIRSSVSPEKTTVAEVLRDPSTMQTVEVTMSKGVTGLGFCLEGGTGSPLGDKPILIKRLFKGGAADKCGLLQEKDEILEVNGKSFQGLRHYEAWNYLKFLPSGDVKLIIRR